MLHPNIILLPAVAAMLWAFCVKFRQRKFVDLLTLLLCTVAMIVNAHLVYNIVTVGTISLRYHVVQMAVCSLIVPLCYLYFWRQVKGIPTFIADHVVLWMLVVLTFVPQIIINNPFEPFLVPESGLKPFAFYVLSHGQKLFAIYTGDLVVILQSMVVINRLVYFVFMIHKYKLHLNSGVYFMCGYWLFSAILAIVFSFLNYDSLHSESGEIFYFCGYSLMLTVFCVFVAKYYDIYQLETEQGVVVEDIDTYVQHQYSDMAGRMRELIEGKELYTDSQLTAERVIEMLHTNRTYFSQMMVAEWGMSFSDYIGNLRLARAESLLSDETLTISNIASQCGFSDAGYMGKKFKAKYGMTPTEWRRTRQAVQ